MEKNDIIELKITDMGVDGEGVGKCAGMTFFVKDAVIGDELYARVIKLKKNYGYARLEELLTPSPDRVVPRCPQHRRCGGCQLQALDYGKQLAYKERKVRDALVRLGGFFECEIERLMMPIVGMDEPYRYRNKAQFPVGRDRDGRVVAGFYAARTHSIIPVGDCVLGVEANEPVLARVRRWMEEYRVEPYDEREGRGLVRHVLTRYGFATGEMMVCLVINGGEIPAKDALIKSLREVSEVVSICLNHNRARTNVILGDETSCIWGRPYITDYIRLREPADFAPTDHTIAYHISPRSFYQVNPVQTEKLYSTALDYAELTGREIVWDLYCGIGTISLFLAHSAKRVCGVEIVPQAIEDARENARLNGIGNVEFRVGKAEDIRPGDLPEPDVIVVDPPRKGCDAACLATILKVCPERIVYVSCDPATLARDLRVLVDGGYELRRIRAFDQFGQTTHVETVVQLVNIGVKPDYTVRVDVDVDEMYKTIGEDKRNYIHSDEYKKIKESWEKKK